MASPSTRASKATRQRRLRLARLFYAKQDAHLHDGLRLKIACSDGVYDLNQVSDGLAGKLMTEEGWFATKSRHGLNAFARSGG